MEEIRGNSFHIMFHKFYSINGLLPNYSLKNINYPLQGLLFSSSTGAANAA